MSDSEGFLVDDDWTCPLCGVALTWGDCTMHGTYLPGSNRMMVTVATGGLL